MALLLLIFTNYNIYIVKEYRQEQAKKRTGIQMTKHFSELGKMYFPKEKPMNNTFDVSSFKLPN